jgi:hypothetical protein
MLVPLALRANYVPSGGPAVLALDVQPPNETIFSSDEVGLKQTPDMVRFDPTTRFGHVGNSQHSLPSILSGASSRDPEV